jgi:colanic acid biosynthesis glycosyl transferase WcaI
MKLLIHDINYTPEPTGIGKYTGEMGSWLAARGHEVHVITAPPHYPEWRLGAAYRGKGWHTEEMDGARVHRAPLYVPDIKKLDAKRRILLETSFTLSSLRWWLPVFLSRERFDAVIAVCPPLQDGLPPYLYGLLRGVPWVFHIQDLQVDAALRLGILHKGVLSGVLYRVENFLLRHATCVSAITEPMRERASTKGAARTLLFPNWADTEFIRPLPCCNPVRAKLGASENDILVLYSGNMGEKQGLELVLEAAARLRCHANVKFALVGAGAARGRLEALASERGLGNVRFFDLFAWEDVPRLLAAGDIHLVVQRREAADLVMPSKLANILAAGRPSIATAESGTALEQVLSEHCAGLVTPPGDIEAFVIALQDLIGNSAKRHTMGRNARAYAEACLDKDAILSRFEVALRCVVDGRQP